jgi:uncharacterized membrane protein
MSGEADEATITRLLEIEFEYLEKSPDKFDNSRFTIKNWSVTTAGALLALTITSGKASVALVGVGAVTVFAYLETLYIYVQDQVAARVRLIERFLDQCSRGRARGRTCQPGRAARPG